MSGDKNKDLEKLKTDTAKAKKDLEKVNTDTTKAKKDLEKIGVDTAKATQDLEAINAEKVKVSEELEGLKTKTSEELQKQADIAQGAATKDFGANLKGYRVTNCSGGNKPILGTGFGRNIPAGGSLVLTEEEFALAVRDIESKPYLTVEKELE